MTQTSFTVSSEGATTSTSLSSLNGVINSIDVGGSNAQSTALITITLSQNITLSDGDLLALNLPNGAMVTIDGAGFSLNGNSNQRGLFVYSDVGGMVTVNNLTLTNMQALGGNGGGAHGGAGGGAGLGGGLFVATAGVVTLDNVTFTSDQAKGGNGGGAGGFALDGSIPADYDSGGGGMGGNGGNTVGAGGNGGGGGGLGLGANGGSGNG